MSFKVEQFIANFNSSPSKALIDDLLRPQLQAVGKHLNLGTLSNMREAEMKQIVFEHFVDDGKLKESVLGEFEVGMTSSDLKEVQLAKLKYKNELVKNERALAMKR